MKLTDSLIYINWMFCSNSEERKLVKFFRSQGKLYGQTEVSKLLCNNLMGNQSSNDWWMQEKKEMMVKNDGSILSSGNWENGNNIWQKTVVRIGHSLGVGHVQNSVSNMMM